MKKMLHIPSNYVAGILGSIFFIYYAYISTTLPVQYWDEALWTGKSYFFDLLVHGRIRDQLWESPPAYDEPKLAEYTYGLLLYPRYLSEKQSAPDTTYIQFLMRYRLLCSECINSMYTQEPIHVTSREAFSDYVRSTQGSETVRLIKTIRLANAVLAALCVSLIFLLSRSGLGALHGVLLSIIYGSNAIVIETSLRAHGDALFFTFYYVALLVLQRILITRKWGDIMLFGLLTGLTAATKVIGFLLLYVYVLWQLLILLAQRLTKTPYVISLLQMGTIIIIAFAFFTITSPYIYTNPLNNTKNMLIWRYDQTKQAAAEDPNNALTNPRQRLASITERFLLGSSKHQYSAPHIFRFYTGTLNWAYALFFILGGIRILIGLFQKKLKLISLYIPITGIMVLISMLNWLSIGWDRYYLFLTLPILTVITGGIMTTIDIWRILIRPLPITQT